MSNLKKLGFLVAFLNPSLILLGYYLGGLWNFSAFAFAYLLIPIADELVGKDRDNIGHDEIDEISDERFFNLILYALMYIQIALIIWGAYIASEFLLTPLEMLGFVLSVMTFTTGGINVAHELGHKKNKIGRFHSKLTLMTVCYMHFYIEHNQGHHVNVATPNDPATSRKGQFFYTFWFQSVIGGWISAWNIEKRRLKRAHLSLWNPIHNQMLQYIIFPLLFLTILVVVFSITSGAFAWLIPIFFFAQSFMAFSSLEAVNYIEHYGIQRKEVSEGRYERVNPLHSWNSNHLVSNWLLFQLQRHSDHHAYASRPYQVLRHFDESPQLPFGYPVMILIALIPPLWFKIMDTRLETWQAQALDAEHIEEVVKKTA